MSERASQCRDFLCVCDELHLCLCLAKTCSPLLIHMIESRNEVLHLLSQSGNLQFPFPLPKVLLTFMIHPYPCNFGRGLSDFWEFPRRREGERIRTHCEYTLSVFRYCQATVFETPRLVVAGAQLPLTPQPRGAGYSPSVVPPFLQSNYITVP